jgi:hypothetical protein
VSTALWVLAGFADLDRFTTRRITRASSAELAASNFGHGPADPGRDSFVRPKLMEHLSESGSAVELHRSTLGTRPAEINNSPLRRHPRPSAPGGRRARDRSWCVAL